MTRLPARTKLLFLVAAYGLAVMLRSCFLHEGRVWFVLVDDAMISMRYAANLASGHGLVWNPGEPPIEGFTNPLWVIYMAFWHWLGIATPWASACIQLTGIVTMLGTASLAMRLAARLSGGSSSAELAAGILVGLHFPLVGWSVMGLEVGALALITCAATLRAHDATKREELDWPLYGLLLTGAALRPDAVVLFAAILAFLVYSRGPAWRSQTAVGLALLAGFMALSTWLRFTIFGELFPNTYYLKLTGFPALPRMARGAYVLANFLWNSNPILLLLPVALADCRRALSRSPIPFVLGAQLLYSVYVGGDAWEHWGNRYVCQAMPLWLTAVAVALVTLLTRTRQAPDASQSDEGRCGELRWSRGVAGSFVIVALLMGNPGGLNELPQSLVLKLPFDARMTHRWVKSARKIQEVTTKDATCAVVWAGALPYFLDRPCVDLLGKMDKQIARMKVTPPAGEEGYLAFYPGHNKHDYAHSIGDLKPDLVVQLVGAPEEAEPYLKADYAVVSLGDGQTIHARKGSARVLWSALAKDGAGYAVRQ